MTETPDITTERDVRNNKKRQGVLTLPPIKEYVYYAVTVRKKQLLDDLFHLNA
jgi:hypothetical protein